MEEIGLICKNCENRIVMHAFSEGMCEICDIKIISTHTPSDKVCNNCSLEFGVCYVCGKKIVED